MKTKTASFVRQEWLQLLLIAIPVLAALMAMPFATDRVPMQWNLRGEVNWYASKSWGLLMIPLTTLLIFPLVFWLESRDRSRHRASDGTLTAPLCSPPSRCCKYSPRSDISRM